MKKIIQVLYLSAIILLFTQCKEQNDSISIDSSNLTNENIVKITGSILNRDIYPNTHEIQIKIPFLTGESYRLISPIEEDNTFFFEFELNKAQDITMLPYLDFLYLSPGDSLHLELDFKNLMDVKLYGNAKALEINHDFYLYFTQALYRDEFHVGTLCEMNCTTKEIMTQLQEIKKIWYERRQEFLQKTKVCEEVVFLTEAMIELDYYKYVSRIMAIKSRLNQDHVSPEKFIEELNRETRKYFDSQWYSSSHFSFIEEAYTWTAYRISPPSSDIKYSEWAKEIVGDKTISDFMTAVQASNSLMNKDLESFEEQYSQIGHKYLLDRLITEYMITWRNMNNPEIASAYLTGKNNIESINMQTRENLFAKTISKNIGKVQVIDIWATWCPACITGLEGYKELIDEYAGKDVSFSFISTSDEEYSNKILLSKGVPPEYNYCTTRDEVSFLFKTFLLKAYPNGILVNKKGVIVDFGAHIYPNQELRKKIDLLLEQDKLIKR